VWEVVKKRFPDIKLEFERMIEDLKRDEADEE
jgi:hypothetical protein